MERALKTSVTRSCPVNSGGMASALVPSHGLGSKCHNAMVRAPTADLTGLCTPWDVCMMRWDRTRERPPVRVSCVIYENCLTSANLGPDPAVERRACSSIVGGGIEGEARGESRSGSTGVG